MTATWFDSGAGCRPGPRMSRADKKTCVHAIPGAEEGARVQFMPGKTHAAIEEAPCCQGKTHAPTEEPVLSGQDACHERGGPVLRACQARRLLATYRRPALGGAHLKHADQRRGDRVKVVVERVLPRPAPSMPPHLAAVRTENGQPRQLGAGHTGAA